MVMKLFDIFDVTDVKVEDPGLRHYIGLDAKFVPRSRGRNRGRFDRAKTNIIERFMGLLAVPGHRGKKHRIIMRCTGKYEKEAKAVIDALKIIEKKLNLNPIQVFVKAIENSSPRDEVTAIEYGGARYPQAVDVSPTRRLGIALRNLVHGSQDKCFRKKTKLAEAIAAEIIAAYQNSADSHAVMKRNEAEKQADGAR